MKKQKPFTLFAGLILLAASCVSADGQSENQAGSKVTINFTELPIDADAAERYVDKGVLLSSRQGKLIGQQYVNTGETMGLCARTSSQFQGVWLPGCADTYIGFVSPSQKMVRTYATNIEIRMWGNGGDVAYWYDDKGNVKTQKASVRSDHKVGFSIPDKTEGVLIIDEDMAQGKGCELCNIVTTSVSFEPLRLDNSPCSEPTRDAAYSHRRLLDESYSPEIYARLEEYRTKLTKTLPIRLQNLLRVRTTYIDEFAIVVQLPGDVHTMAQEIFRDMRRRLDKVGVGPDAVDFTDLGEFSYFEPDKIKSRPDQLPTVGDIFQVDIALTDNGDVMMTALSESPAASWFRYSTLNNGLHRWSAMQKSGNLRHPNNGSREYGYLTTLDGRTKFYVRGVDQFDVPAAGGVGKRIQKNFWLSLLRGIGRRVEENQGKIIYEAEQTIDDVIPVLPSCHVPIKLGYDTKPY